MKEAKWKIIHLVSFHLYNVQEKPKLTYDDRNQTVDMCGEEIDQEA